MMLFKVWVLEFKIIKIITKNLRPKSEVFLCHKIMGEELVRTLGTVKVSEFQKDFDKVYDKYNLKAKQMGYNGNLKFRKEGGKITIFVII